MRRTEGALHALSSLVRPCLLRLLPRGARLRIRRMLPPRRFTRVGRRLTPVQRDPFARGTPIDRYYIEHFLRRWNPNGIDRDIRGRVLEFYDSRYATQIAGFGTESSAIAELDIIDVTDNPRANVRADISDAPHLPSEAYDAIICTQVLHLVLDFRGALATLARLLKPEGVLYVTVPGISQDFGEGEANGIEYWRFTDASVRALMLEHFDGYDLVVESFGNVLTAVAFLHGLAAEEFKQPELDRRDHRYHVVVAARARKG
jgi:SAM-dependent methyltransferase